MDVEAMAAMHERGATYSEIARAFGVSRNVVAGAMFRRKPKAKQGFRDVEAVKGRVALADGVGVKKAARLLNMHWTHLYNERARLRAMDAV